VASLPWIVTPERSSNRQLVQQLFAERGSDLVPAVEADNESVITNLIESGVGVSLVRDEIAQAASARSVVWPGGQMQTELWLVHGADRRFDPLIVAILDILQELWRSVAHAPDRDEVPG
jgi:DNA-binding transcriptional LysR family regulator